jgi:phage repressor protein C with HTH and peptisase S24 domain
MNDDEIGVLVKKARAAKGWSQPELARRVSALGRRCSQQTIGKLETGQLKNSTFLPAIATSLDIPLDRVLRLDHRNSATASIPGHTLVGGERDLPVYAAASRGAGVQVLSTDPVEYVLRPEPLARVRDGYGVYALDDTMSPQYRAGDIVLINPHMPARAGDTCVFRGVDKQDGGVVIRFLRAVDPEEWHVTEWCSQAKRERRDYKLKRSEWQAHVAVGCYARR